MRSLFIGKRNFCHIIDLFLLDLTSKLLDLHSMREEKKKLLKIHELLLQSNKPTVVRWQKQKEEMIDNE